MNVFKVVVLLSVIFSQSIPGLTQEGWELKKEKDGIRVYTKDIKDSDFKAFRGQTEVKGQLSDVIAVLLDVDQYKEWMPDTKSVKVLKEDSETDITYYVATDVPWPVSDRDGVYQMRVSYDKETPSISIFVKALPDYVEEYKGHVRVRKSDTVYKLVQVGENRVMVDYEVAAEPGGGIPAWMVKMKVVSIPFESLEALRTRINRDLYAGKTFGFMQK